MLCTLCSICDWGVLPMNSFDLSIHCEEDPGYLHYCYMLELQQEEEYLALKDQEYCDMVNDLIQSILHGDEKESVYAVL